MIGSRLGPYEITAKLGEGGMGEVYRATDTKLKRDVAIKVLPAAFTEDKERLARFEREAQLLAQLQHPNIASIYGMEESGGTRALVMELVEGPTLAERLEHGPLPLGDCLSISLQIAQALDAAHEKGIVHRDLKPQNIKASLEGKVKVLDFGLAKAMDPAGTASGQPTASQLGRSPTMTLGATQMGVILGTAAYMAPEQAKGLAVDKRADIWAFGVVLHEMLTGRSLFAGDSVPDTLARVLQRDIDFDALPASTPPAIQRLLRRCLERNPKNRLHDIADARLELEEAASWTPQSAAPAPRTPRRAAIPIALSCGVAIGVLGWSMFGSKPHDRTLASRPLRLSIVNPPSAPFLYWGQAAVSPDGERVAFVGTTAGDHTQIYLQELAEEAPHPIAGTEGGMHPFWSPDGRQIAFFAHGQLARIDLRGGPARNLAPAPDPRGGTWSRDGTILFNSGYRTPLSRVSAEGGPVVAASQMGPREEGNTWPSFLPDGRHFVFLGDAVRTEDHHLKLGVLDSMESVELGVVVSKVAAATPGYVLYVRSGALIAQRLDVSAGKLVGEAVQIASQVVETTGNHGFEFSVSDSSRLTYRSASPLSVLEWFDRTGRALGRVGEPRRMKYSISLSPDARRVAWEEEDADGRNADVWVRDLERGLDTRISFDPASDLAPVWSPSGDRLAWTSYGTGGGDIYEDSAWNPGNAKLLAGSAVEKVVQVWSSQALLALTNGDVILQPLDPDAAPRPLVASAGQQYDAALSRDERWLAYASEESGKAEIYLQPFPPTGKRWQVSVGGGAQPRWRADGRELYFLDVDSTLHAVAIDPGSDSPPGTPRALFDLDDPADYDAAPDGQRFLVQRSLENRFVAPLTVLTDWRALIDAPGGR